MLVKFNTKALIHYQSSTSMAQRLKQNTFNMLSLPQKGFVSRKEQIIHKFERSQRLNSTYLYKSFGAKQIRQIIHKFERSQSLNRTYLYKSFGDNQIRYVGGGTCLKCLSPLGKSSASLGMCKVTSGVAWRPVSHMCVHVMTSGAAWCPVSQSHVCVN